MRSNAKLFFLAVYALWAEPLHASGHQAKQDSAKSSSVCAVSGKSKRSPPPPATVRAGRKTYTVGFQYEPNSIVSDACTSYSSLDEINSILGPQLRDITRNTDFFSHYRLNLFNKKCPFWSDENGMCGNIACSVNTLENEEDIPLVWRAEELGKLEGPKAEHPGKQQQKERPSQRPLQGQLGEDVGESCVLEYDDECDERDYCVPEDERSSSKGDYVSLADNPERFTGYSGAGAQQVWEAIYRENCFSKPSKDDTSSPASSPFGMGNSPFPAQAANDLFAVMKEQNIQQGVQDAIAHRGSGKIKLHELEFDQECLEKRVFYRIVSGMHASISTHLCYEYLNQSTGQWSPNPQCFKERVGDYPERLSNIYFNYALLLRAVAKLNGQLKDYTFCSADPFQNKETKLKAVAISDTVKSSGEIFDETAMFKSPDAIGLKEDFKLRFRNISRIMDCVGCDKCRLWGKVQTNGYGTALKILFEFDEKNPKKDPHLRRTELVALINTLNRVSYSLNAIQHFRELLEPAEAPISSNNTIPQGKADEEKAEEILTPQEQEEDDTEPPPNLKRKSTKNMSTLEVFYQELDLVWRAYTYVLKQWIGIPKTVYHIIRWEAHRFWRAFLGLQTTERGWSIHIPRRDEL